MSSEKIRRIFTIRRNIIPRIYYKVFEINDWWRHKYPLYSELICHISNVCIEIIDTVPSVTVTMHDSRNLLVFAFKIHGDTIDEGINNFGNDYKKLLEIVKDNQIKINNCIYQEVLKSRLEKEK